MSLSFLHPALLWGLAAAAIPLAIHLFHRRRPKAVPFPAIDFVMQARRETERRLKLRRVLLFAARTALLAAAALAIARPQPHRARGPGRAGAGRPGGDRGGPRHLRLDGLPAGRPDAPRPGTGGRPRGARVARPRRAGHRGDLRWRRRGAGRPARLRPPGPAPGRRRCRGRGSRTPTSPPASPPPCARSAIRRRPPPRAAGSSSPPTSPPAPGGSTPPRRWSRPPPGRCAPRWCSSTRPAGSRSAIAGSPGWWPSRSRPPAPTATGSASP